MKRVVALLCAALAVTGCARSLAPDQERPGGSYRQQLDLGYDGLRRSYRLHVPSSYSDLAPLPLVVVIHGAFSQASEMEQRTGFSRLADREGFVVAYPEGIGLLGLLQHWNAGYCCGHASEEGIDDVEFLSRVIEDVSALLKIDRSRIYMAGFSNGAMLAHAFAASRGEVLAGVATLAGAIGGRSEADQPIRTVPEPDAVVPMILFHGLEDPVVPYYGGRRAGERNGHVHLPALQSAAFWAQANHCSGGADETLLFDGAVTKSTWSGCPADGEVVLYSLRGWDHRWPGPAMMKQDGADAALAGLDATAIIWDFFRRQRSERCGPAGASPGVNPRDRC